MRSLYHILERLPDGKLLRIETVDSLEQAKLRFSSLTLCSRRQYLVYDPTRGREIALLASMETHLEKVVPQS
jgi:hypothetical protein